MSRHEKQKSRSSKAAKVTSDYWKAPIAALTSIENKLAKTRREALIFFLSSAVFGGSLWSLDRLDKYFELRAKYKDLVFDFLFGTSSKQFYVPSFDNPYSPLKRGEMTAPTRDALTSVFERIGLKPENAKVLPQDLRVSLLDGSVALFGGPVPNPLSRHILGQGEGSPLLLQTLAKSVQLPIHFSNILSGEPKVGSRPKYNIIVNGSRLSIADEAVEDFLVITSIPNLYSPGYALGHRLNNFAGLHGPGMRAIDLVLDTAFLEKLIKETHAAKHRSPGWQAIIKIAIDRHSEAPREIVDWRVFDIENVDFDKVYKNIRQRPVNTYSI